MSKKVPFLKSKGRYSDRLLAHVQGIDDAVLILIRGSAVVVARANTAPQATENVTGIERIYDAIGVGVPSALR